MFKFSTSHLSRAVSAAVLASAFVSGGSAVAQTFTSASSSTSFSFPGQTPQQPATSPQFQCLSTALVNFPGTIVDAAVQTPELSTLVSLVTAAGLVGPLAGPGPLTVFAPTNAAFAKIPPTVLSAIGRDIGLLTSVLTYHVSPGRIDPRFDFTPREIPTLQGQTLFVEFEQGVGPQVNQSVANCKGVRTTNGVVWIIDSVLQPQYR